MTTESPGRQFHPPEHSPGQHSELKHIIASAAHYLPIQGPIEVFVHHNTLHVYESMPFHEAVKAGFKRFQAEPYLTEQEYQQHYRSGLITDDDLQSVLARLLDGQQDQTIDSLGTRSEICLTMLKHPLHVGPDAELRWLVAETNALDRFLDGVSPDSQRQIISSAKRWLEHANSDQRQRYEIQDLLQSYSGSPGSWSESKWESFSLHLLYRICLKGSELSGPLDSPEHSVRPRDLLLHATGEDIDLVVNELLVRFCAAYVDQGYSDWLLPNRDIGFYEAFLELYANRSLCPDRWMDGLSKQINYLLTENISAEQSIVESLKSLQIPAEQWQEFVTQTLLALKGWAGIIEQLESGVDWVVHRIPQNSLTGYLAVRLLLEQCALRNLGQQALGMKGDLDKVLSESRRRLETPKQLIPQRHAFFLLQTAQKLGWTIEVLESLTAEDWNTLIRQLNEFTGLERRQVFHEAFEQRFIRTALDAFAIHTSRIQSTAADVEKKRPSFQIITCIDDREESFRRHMEEIDPRCETFGAAGFFAVAMYYRGAADGFFKPLCPGVVIPDHYVQEDVGYTFEGVHRNRAGLRKQLGKAQYQFQTGSRSLWGGLFAGILGSLATAPLVARVLLPHLTAKIRKRVGSLLKPPPFTQLQLERYAEMPGPDNGHIGYSVPEMAQVVTRLLQDIGLTQQDRFSRLMILCGHGSSSLNNPHESAYCCGACAGKRGGPNARAFAQMANDWRVRRLVAEQGIVIPDDMVFVGAYHNTCDDSVVYYDLDRMPSSHREDFEHARSVIEQGRRRNAHERCRRFDNAPLTLSFSEALRHVEARAEDISQVRPEYNHATNALCVVGRREWTKGLFLDRRAFLTSYDPAVDDEESNILLRILSAVIPVCAGINLEYYFSRVDSNQYGSGSKLPHNIVSLLGVMEGTASDLRTGLYRQMVEIHDPLRITFVIESTPEAMLLVMKRNSAIRQLIEGEWVHVAVINPQTSEIQRYHAGEFRLYQPATDRLPVAQSSLMCYQGSRENRPFSSIDQKGHSS